MTAVYEELPFGTRSPKGRDAVFIWFYARNCDSYAGYPHNEIPSTSLVLAQLRWDGSFGAVGGGVDKGEELLDAILRECKEEINYIPTSINELITRRNTRSHFHIHCYTCELSYEELKKVRDNASTGEHFDAECAGVNLMHICRYSTGRGERGWVNIMEQNFASTGKMDLQLLVEKENLIVDYRNENTYRKV